MAQPLHFFRMILNISVKRVINSSFLRCLLIGLKMTSVSLGLNFIFLAVPSYAINNFQLEKNNCEELAKKLSKNSGLPDGLLGSIARVESGRINKNGVKRAWPWTLNLAGDSKFFDNKSQTLEYLNNAISEGKTNIDIGCMQINYRWHKNNFPTVEEMLDPKSNINYAIKFLNELFEKHNSWEDAVKHYHSATKSLNTKYYRKIARVFNTIRNEESSNNLSFIDALPPLNNSSTEGSVLTGSNNEKSLALLTSSNEIENNYFKSKINVLKKEQNEISLVEYNTHYGRNIDFVNLTVPLDKKDEKPKSHLPKYIKEKWKLVLAMRSILGNN